MIAVFLNGIHVEEDDIGSLQFGPYCINISIENDPCLSSLTSEVGTSFAPPCSIPPKLSFAFLRLSASECHGTEFVFSRKKKRKKANIRWLRVVLLENEEED